MSNNKSITVEQLKEAYQTHGEDFLILDVFPTMIKGEIKSKLRANKNETVQYGDVLIKKADGEIVPLIIEFRQITTFGRIKEPEQRDYESIKLHLKKNDLLNFESQFGEMVDVICKTFESKVEQFVTDGKISTKPKKNCLKVHSTELRTPMQYVATKDNEVIDLENPSLWIELKTRMYNSEDLNKLEQYNDLIYKGDGKPILIKDFNVAIHDLTLVEKVDKVKFNRITNKREIVKRTIIPLAKTKDENYINNCNVHSFITKGSALSGKIEMGIVISKGYFNLRTTFKDKIYVYPNEDNNSGNDHEVDEDEIDDMIPTNLTTFSSTNTQEEVVVGDDDDDDDDDELSKQLDKINN